MPVLAGAREAPTGDRAKRGVAVSAARVRDRFDDVPEDLARVGAHRAPARPAGAFVVLAWAALATGLLVGAGVLGLSAIEDRISGSETSVATSAAASSAGPAATVDPSAQVLILNGTTTNGLAGSAAAAAKASGWTSSSTATATSQDVKTSTVYYSKASQEGAARGLAKSLGIGDAVLSKQFAVAGQDRLTVVLGADYAAATG